MVALKSPGRTPSAATANTHRDGDEKCSSQGCVALPLSGACGSRYSLSDREPAWVGLRFGQVVQKVTLVLHTLTAKQ